MTTDIAAAPSRAAVVVYEPKMSRHATSSRLMSFAADAPHFIYAPFISADERRCFKSAPSAYFTRRCLRVMFATAFMPPLTCRMPRTVVIQTFSMRNIAQTRRSHVCARHYAMMPRVHALRRVARFICR